MALLESSDGHVPLCGAAARTGSPCRLEAGWGTDHVGVGTCKYHLGSTRTHRARGKLMLAERDAAASLAEIGYEPIGDPIEELADVAAQAKALMSFFANKVADLGSLRYRSEGGTEQLRAEVSLYERAMDRTAKLLEALGRLGLEEHRQARNDAVADNYLALMRATAELQASLLASLGVSVEQLQAWREATPRLVRQAAQASGVIDTTGAENP